MSRSLSTSLTLFLLLTATAVFAAGGSQQSTPPVSSATPQQLSPEELAKQHYNRGLGQRDRAWKIEGKLETAADKKQEKKFRKKIASAYRSATREFEEAVRNDESLYQAWSSLGYAQRKLGDYEASLEAYNRALSIEPRYAEATEYRGEAYLGLSRLDDAREAYMQLFGGAREHAAALLKAMRTWVDEHPDEAGTFADWVTERETIADQTARLDLPARDW